MSVWDLYEARLDARGSTRRGTQLLREKRLLLTKLPHSLSYHTVTIDDVEQNVAIINTDNLDTKYIYSLPGEDIRHGGLVFWSDNYWLVTERDANIEVYTRAKMIQCNYLLRWVDSNSEIHEQWCIIEDGTKYLTGEYEDKDFVITRGDSRISMTIAKNEYTAAMRRTNRFLIDDPDSPHMLAYSLTKPLKLGGWFNGNGVYTFVLQEVNTTDDDNQELRIADYYKHFPDGPAEIPPELPRPGETPGDTGGKKVWF